MLQEEGDKAKSHVAKMLVFTCEQPMRKAKAVRYQFT